MFKNFNLRKRLEEGIEKIGFENPTEIQKIIIPLACKRKNIVGVSRTGSGKTHAFLIPIFQNIKTEFQAVQSIIISPTRELATQIHKMAVELARASGIELKISLFIGGSDINKQMDNLTVQPHIVIGTPTRIHQLYTSGHLFYTTTSSVVIDEADMAMDLGFFDIVDELLSKVSDKCQKMVFSATLTEQISHHLSKYIKNATIVRIGDLWIHPNTTHIIVPVKENEKEDVLLKTLEKINPYMCMIFANEKEQVEKINRMLLSKGLNVGMIHGGLEARDRKNKFKDIKDLKFKYVVCSDIAARGVDIDGVSHVIHWDLPETDDWYIHRAGRTGRGKLHGESIILFDDAQKNIIDRLKNKGIKFIVKKITSEGWKEASLTDNKRKRKMITLADRAVNEMYKNVRKNQKVKPGYKRKLRVEATRIRKKHKRAIIEETIKQTLKRKWIDESKKKKLATEEL